MKKLKIYFGAVALMLLATQCNMMPWFPVVDPGPIVNPVVPPEITTEYYVHLGDTAINECQVLIGESLQLVFFPIDQPDMPWSWDNAIYCTHVDSVGYEARPGLMDDYDVTAYPDGVMPKIGIHGASQAWIIKGAEVGTDTLKFVYKSFGEYKTVKDSTVSVVVHVIGYEPLYY